MERVALIVAGGRGERMNSEIPKQFLCLNNIPILIHTARQFSHFEKMVIVLHKTQFNYWKKICAEVNFKTPHVLVEGGENRFQSVKNGLAKIDRNSTIAIHDGVRPFVSKSLIDDLMSQTKKGVGLIPVLPIKDSIRMVEGGNSYHVDRNNIYQVQTPQCFISTDIKTAYKQEFSKKFTDDASILENDGGKIVSILGEIKNLKITTKEDLRIAEMFMQ